MTKHKISEETKKKMSESHKKIGAPWMIGRKMSKETRIKIGKAQKGNKNYFFGKRFLGIKNPNWKADNISYVGIHAWISREFGKPDKCDDCGETGLFRCKIHWANKSKLYKRDISDWVRLCVPCHKKYDMERIRNEQ